MDRKELKAILDPIIPGEYLLFEFDDDNELSVKQIVENEGFDFKYGRAYYQFKICKNKKGEVISLSKKIIAIDKETKKVFLDEEARAIIGTPDTVETAKKSYIPPDNIRENYLIFIQSKSWKRVPKKCFLIYLINNGE
ncbi:MAG: hypothetical protein ACFE96_17720 [Candidatus Hermodarchaeota archaeon]